MSSEKKQPSPPTSVWEELAQNATVIKQFDPRLQRDVLGMYAMLAFQPKDSVKELEDLALQMTVLREAMRGNSGDSQGGAACSAGRIGSTA